MTDLIGTVTDEEILERYGVRKLLADKQALERDLAARDAEIERLRGHLEALKNFASKTLVLDAKWAEEFARAALEI